MRVLITGHDGYIGAILAPLVRAAGHDVVGLDTGFYEGCSYGGDPEEGPSHRIDIRAVDDGHFRDVDAVIHLAALSNDPLGNLDARRTYEINHEATIRLARLAKAAGVERFVFASSCSLYGAASPDDLLTESAPMNPVSAYGHAKVLAERDLARLADDAFSPVFLRNATVYGYSPRLRLDLVVNDLVANAHATGRVLIKSDGTPWRPLVHVRDAAGAALCALEAPRDLVHGQAFNIGRTAENYRVSDLAELATETLPGTRVVFAKDAGPDPRCYRVDFSRAEDTLPGFEPTWNVRDGMRELADAHRRHGLLASDLSSPRFIRLRRITELQADGRLGPDLRWLPVQAGATSGPSHR
ncbi:MAG TPA: SDR family oxidoreductase [Actinomycetota bacterium]